MSEVTIRKLQFNDLQEVTCIHLAAFPISALSQLGEESVLRYYQWLLQGPHNAITLGVYCEGSLAGFCFAGRFQGALSGFLRKNIGFLIWQVLSHPWLLANSLFLKRMNLARAVLLRWFVPVMPSPPLLKNSFGILSIAVNPKLLGNGYGRRLMLEVKKIAVERGFANMHLTVSVDNYQAITFYEKLGWHKLLASDGVWHGIMMEHLKND